MPALPPPSSHETPSVAIPTPPVPERRSGLTPVSLFLVLLIAYLAVKVQLILVLTLMAILFATIIERPVIALERRHIPRSLSILIVYIAILGSLVLLSLILVPVI